MPEAFVSIPYPNVDYPVDITWPLIGQFAVGSAFQQNGNPRYNAAPTTVFSAPTIAGAGVANMGLYHGLFCGQFETALAAGTVAATLDGVSMYAAIEKNNVAAGFRFGEQVRVWRLSLSMALQVGAALTDESGIVLEPAEALAPGWIKNGNRGMGIVFNAGVPTYVSKNAGGVGAYSEIVPLTWPSAVTEWVGVDFEIISASSIGEATFNLYLNGAAVPAISRPWGAGTKLPTYASPAGAARFTAAVRMGDTGIAESLKIAAGMRFTAGRFTLSGAQV